MASAITEADGWRIVSLFLTGIALTLMAGYSLTKVLVTSAATSWRMDLRQVRIRVMTVLPLSGILFAGIAVAAVLAVLREHASIVGASAVWVTIAAITGVAWFGVTLTLPRPVNDPGALLPGAIVFALANTALQAVMHVYLPNKINRTTDTFGGLAATVAVSLLARSRSEAHVPDGPKPGSTGVKDRSEPDVMTAPTADLRASCSPSS